MAMLCHAQDGTNAYNFLSIPVSSHIYAVGGHNITIIDDDINLVEQNPALMGGEIDKQVGLNYMRYLGGSNFMGARYGQGISKHGALAVGLQYYSYGSMEGYDITGTAMGQFSASDLNFNVTYSHDINDYLRGGITVKLLHSKYEQYSATAIAADLGVNYYNPDHEVSASIVAKHLGGQVKQFNDKKDPLPWDIQLGVSKTFTGLPLRLSLTAYGLTKWKSPYLTPSDNNNTRSTLVEKESFASNLLRHLVFGVEVLPKDNLYLAIGYNYRTRTDMSTYNRNFLSGFSVGAGLRVKSFGLGVALAQPHTGATTLMFNLTTTLGELLR
ncbi:MAG: type IX secretion system protein PorQ [Muribaculaceae bacterium]|nr:type IX secretion system protein PorQ [Muribaculaceae bacterium]